MGAAPAKCIEDDGLPRLDVLEVHWDVLEVFCDVLFPMVLQCDNAWVGRSVCTVFTSPSTGGVLVVHRECTGRLMSLPGYTSEMNNYGCG